MSVKLSKKNLKEMATDLGAYDLGGNIYCYENTVGFLNILFQNNRQEVMEYRQKMLENIKINCRNKNLIYFLENLIKKEYVEIIIKQIAYSYGTYGNNGQIHKVEIKADNEDKTIFIYCA